MIKFPFGYYIDSDSHNVILGIPKQVTDKNGKTSTKMQNATYYRTPHQALQALYERKIREAVGKTSGDMQDLIEAMGKVRDELLDGAESLTGVQIIFKAD